ncbi:hypothetical protein [Haloferula sp.]|uniref:hypothetical protein n=1 Tax=Haloferula sp. TaxID=2497595 RepID=UPI00329F281F
MLRVLLTCLLLTIAVRADRVNDYHEWQQACVNAKDAKVIDGYIARFQSRVDADPKDHLAKVNLGSAYTLRSAESFWGPKKLEYLKKGGKIMDEAVAAAPKDVRVRFLRATNAYRVPKRFGRRPVAVADFQILMPVAIKGGHGLKMNERQAILFYAWRTFQEEGRVADAAKAKVGCHRLDKGSWYGKETAK